MRRGRDSAPRWTALAVVVAVTFCAVLAEGCSDGAFSCADQSGCVDASMVQDGVADCRDGSDEGCRPLQFRCPCLFSAEGRRGPRCLDPEMVRDGVEDCVDGADEGPEGSVTAENDCPTEEPSSVVNEVVRSKRRASEVSTRIDGPVTTSMFAEEGGNRRVRPTGILTSTAGTFVLDGTTTEFATKVYGTHLDDGVYAKIVSTSSRVFFAVPSAGTLARIRPTGLLSSTTSTRVDGTETTLYTTEFSGTYIDGMYAQLVSSTSRVIRTQPPTPTATVTSQTYQTAAPHLRPSHQYEAALAAPHEEDSSGEVAPDQVVTVTGTRGALVDGGETRYDVFTGTHVKGDKTYLFFFGNTALSPTAVVREGGATVMRPPPGKASELVVRTGADDRIVVSVDNRELNLLLPKSARASAAESGMATGTGDTEGGMRGVFIEGSEFLGGFSILGATEEIPGTKTAQTEMLTVTVGKGVAQTKIVRGRYDGLWGEQDEQEKTAVMENMSPTQASPEMAAQPDRTVYRFPPRIPALRPPRPAFGGLAYGDAPKQKHTKDGREQEAAEEEDSENLLKARKLDFKEDSDRNPSIRPSKVYRANLPTFTVGQDGFQGTEEEGKVVVRVDHNVEARVGPRKDYRTLSARQRMGKSLPFRGFQVIHEKEDLVNAESGGSVPVPTITYFGFAEFTTTAHGTVIVFMPRSQEAILPTASYSPKTTAVSAYRLPSTRLPGKEGPAYEAGGKQKVATGIKTFYSHTPGMVTRTVTGHSLSMQTSLPTVLVEPVFGISAHSREKNGRSEEDPSDAELVYPTSDAPEEPPTTEGEEAVDLRPSVTQPTADVVTSTSTYIENAHGRPFSVDLESSIISIDSSSSVMSSPLDDGLQTARPTDPLRPTTTSGVIDSTETLPVGLIRSIGGTRTLDGTTTFITSLIYGTYVNGDYKQIIQTTTSVLQQASTSEMPTTPANTEATERATTEREESSTTSNSPTVADVSETTFVTKEMTEESTPVAMTTGMDDEDGVISTIPASASTTEESELANEVETGRRVNARPEQQVIVAEDDRPPEDKEMISALGKGAPQIPNEEETAKPSYVYSIIPTTIYQTYTYFTTFYIPSDGTTSTSIRSRETIVSELALATRTYTVSSAPVSVTAAATTEPTTQSLAPTTPMTPVTEETPELPRDRITTVLDESTTAEPPATTPTTPSTTPLTKDESSESEEDEESEEIELIFKTLYTTYTYLTTFFHDTTTSVSSREVVVTNVLTSTLNSVTLATEPALAGLVRDHDLSTALPSPSMPDDDEETEVIPTSVGVGRPTTQFFSEDTLSSTPTAPLLSTPSVDLENAKENDADVRGPFRTFYTTYTYFTTVFVDGETEISSRTEVYTNIIPPSGLIRPTATAVLNTRQHATSVEPSNPSNEVDPENPVRASISVANPNRYSSTILHRPSRKKIDPVTTPEATTELIEELRNSEQDSVPISSEKHEEKEDATLVDIQNDHAENNVRVETTTTSTTSSVGTSEENVTVTTEKYFGVTKFEDVGEPEKLVSEEDDQESSESNTEVVLPVPLPSPTPTLYRETSVLVQTTFTTFTYFTTLYRGGTSEVVSRLETVTNIMSVTVEPTARLTDKIQSTDAVNIKPTLTKPVKELETTEVDESLYPITYFTTFTYWTTAYKGGSTVVNSREETVSNIVTSTGRPPITREIEHSPPIPTTEAIQSTSAEPVENTLPTTSTIVISSLTPSPVAAPQLTTFYTTYTYFTTSYVGDSTIVNSRLETVTNVEAGDTQTARAIGASPPSQQQIITPTASSQFPIGLLSTIRTSSVGEDSRTTLYSTDVYGTFIDGLYAKVLESSTKVLVEPTSTSTPALPKVNLQPTGIVSLNAGSIVDAEGTATTFYSTMAIGTFIGNLYAQVVESTSSIVIDTEKTAIPLNTVSQRTGLVRLIKGSIVKGESTTFYESRVVGTVIDGRYAQIIESTSSFKAAEATKAAEDGVFPTPTTAPVLTSTAAPALESSLGELGASTPATKDEDHDEGDGEGSEEGDDGDEGDDEDSNNANKGRVTSRLTFSSRRRTFTPVIRPFSSRNRPTFHPRRRPTSATTITRVTQTPTVTATPAHTDYLAATAARGRFTSRRGGASSADVRGSASGGSRRFSRIRGSSTPGGAGGLYGSSSYFGGGRGRGSSTRIIPTAASTLPFGGSRSRPGSYRSSFAGGGRSSSEYPYGRTSSSAALFAANSRFRIRPSSTSAYLRPTLLASSSPPPFDRNTVEDDDEESTEVDEEDEVGTEKEEGTRATEPTESTPLETALTPTTEGTTSPFRRPLLRLRRPNQYQPPSPPSTTPSSLPRSTAARRLSLLRRPNGEENLPNEDRKQPRPRYKASSASPTKPAKTPTTPRPRSPPPPRLQVLNRARPTSSLFPRRGLFRRPGEDQEKQAEEAKEEESSEDEGEIVEEAESANDGSDDDNGDDSYNLDDTIADNDYEASEDVKSKNEPPRVLIRPFTPRRRRLKRQAEYGTRGGSNSGSLRGYSSRFRRPGSRKNAQTQETEAKVAIEEEVEFTEEDLTSQKQTEPARHSPSRSRNSGHQQPRVRPTAPSVQSRSQYTVSGNRNKNTNGNANNRETNTRTAFRRPSTTSSVRRRNKSETTAPNQQQQRPKPPRLRTQSEAQTTATATAKPRSRGRFSNRGRSQSASTAANTGRSRYRTSDSESNDYSTRRQYQQSSWDGKVTVTHQVPTEATIPVVNGKNTEYRRVLTASPSTQILTPGQYEATEISGVAGLLLLGSDVTATPTPGVIHVTQYVARETPTSSVEFTPTVIRGRKTSFSHVVPSTAYGVEEIVSTLPSENGLLPSAPLANILLSQLLLGQFGLQGNVNPLLGLQQPNAAALAPLTPTTEFKTRSTTFVTTLTDKTSTVIPITLRGKAILTTIVDSSVQVVTATEFITETIVVTPTAAPQQQLNSLLLPALLQAQLLNQQQQQQQPLSNPLSGQLTPLQAAQLLQGQQQPTLPVARNDRPDIDSKEVIQEEEYLDNVSPATERRRQPSSSRRRNRPHKRVEAVAEDRVEGEEGPRPARGSEDEIPRPKTRKNKSSSGRKQNPPAERQYETSVITLYVSGRRPGDFSTVLSTISVDTAGSSLVKREAVSPKRFPSIQHVTTSPSLFGTKNNNFETGPEKFTNSLPFKDPNILISPSNVNFVQNSDADKQIIKTESLESIVGDVSKHVTYQSSSIPATWSVSRSQPSVATSEERPAAASSSSPHTPTGHFLADGPAELAPLKRKVLSIDEGVEEDEESDTDVIRKSEGDFYHLRGKREIRDEEDETGTHERPQRRRRIKVRVPVRKHQGSDERSARGQTPRAEQEGEVLLASEAQRKTALNDMRHDNEETQREAEDGGEYSRRSEDVETDAGLGFPSRRIKVAQGRALSTAEDGAGNKKRIRVKVRRKPTAVADDVLPRPSAPREGENVEGRVEASEVRRVKAVRGSSGRRRIVVTKKRPLSTSANPERATVVPESTGRHRIVVTRRRPVHRQSAQVTATPTTTFQGREDEASVGTDARSTTPTPENSPSSEATPEDRPTARRVPPGGTSLNEGFGSRKTPPTSRDKGQDSGKHASRAPQKAEKEEREEKEEEVVEEERGRETEVEGAVDAWLPSRAADVALPPKSIEPSFWSGEEAGAAETELLPRPPKTSSTRQEESTVNTDGPRFVRPTRFSVTRRPSGDFLQKVQSQRTKAPIVFPSRRRPSASTRQPAYRSRLSRLRGRPSSTSFSEPATTTTFSEPTALVEPSTSIELEAVPTAVPTQTPTYVTETLTETLLKTYTYVVSRVESSAEAGVGEAAPPSLAAVSSTTEVKQVVKTRTVTRLVSPTTASSSAVAEPSTAQFNETEEKGVEQDGRAIGGRINLDAARFNLATRVMSNGVEVIVAGDKTTLPGGPDVLRILSTASRPITLAPSTLSDQMQLTVPTASGGEKPQGDPESLLLSLQSQAAIFVTKTYATTYTYLTTFLQGTSTAVSSREDVISNVVTEEVRPTRPIQQHTATSLSNEALTSEVDGPPSFVTSTYRTTFTYLNTIIDGEVPVVLTTRQTVANTVTSPANPSKIAGSSPEESGPGYLQPSEPTLYDTNTYFNTFTLTKTLSDSASGVKVISTEDVLTQVVITEASTPATSQVPVKISPTSTTSIVKTYFVTYTYYNTFLEKGSTVVKTNVATSSDVVTEKFYLAPTRTPPTNQIPMLTNVPTIDSGDQHPLKTSVGTATLQPPFSVFATKTYMTTFTYFTTLLENDQTVTRSSISVSTNLATEAITAGLDSVYLDSLRSSFSMQTAHAPIVATVMLSGTPMEITAFQGSALDTTKSPADIQKIGSTETVNEGNEKSSEKISPSTTTPGNVIVGSTIIFFDDVKPQKPQDSDVNELSATTSLNSEPMTNFYGTKDDEITSQTPTNSAHTDTPEFLLSSLSTSPTPVDVALSAESGISIPQISYITSTITASTVIASGNGLATTLVPGDAVIVSMRPDGNVSLIPVSDPTNKHPDGALLGAGAVESVGGVGGGGGLLAAASGGPNIGVGDLINLGSLSLNGLNALGPVFNAMAGLLQSNLKSSRRNDTTTPYPPTTPRTPPPIALPRPPAPQSAPLIRDPVYIPVGGLASLTSEQLDPIAAESTHGESIEAYYGQHFPIHGFPDTEERRPPPSPVKPSMPTTLTLDNPLLLQNGIPIQPGQVITTNSDVIVGKPSVLGPRPSSHGGIPQIFPQNHPPLPPVNHPSPPVLTPNHSPLSNYPPKPAILPPHRVRPGNDVPPEMRPPPPPRYPSYSGVSPTRVSVISGVETVFIGKPLPPHMVPENHSPTSHLIPQLPTFPAGPLRGNPGNYQSPLHIPPPIIVGSSLDGLNPHPALHHNYNTIDRSTGYKIRPSQSLNIPIEAVTLSVGSEAHATIHDNVDSFFDISAPPLSGGRPGSVLNEGEPHSGPQLSLGQAQVHNVPVGTGGEVVVEIGRPPNTSVLKENPYAEETKIITNEDSSEENKGVVQEEGDVSINREPTIIHLGQSDHNNHHPGHIIVGHGRPHHQLPNQSYQPNYFVSARPNPPPSNNPPSHFPNVHHPHSSGGSIHRPPPPSNLYTNGMGTHSGPVDHLMPPPPPRPSSNPLAQSEGLHKNDGPIIIPLNHGSEEAPQINSQGGALSSFSDNVRQPWVDSVDDDLGEPEDEEGAQDGEVLQESNNRPVRPGQSSTGGHQHSDRPNILPDIHPNKEKPFVTNFQHSHPETHFQHSSQNPDVNSQVITGEFRPANKMNASDGNFANQKPPKQQHTLPGSPPYRFEIPDMPPPPPPQSPPKPTQAPKLPSNAQRPPPGAVSRPAIRPQDYNPDFLDKPIRIATRPQPPSRTPMLDGTSIQENAIRPEVSRPPVRVVVRPVSPHRPRPPPYHNHHVPQSRPSQISHWPRPLRPLKPPGPAQVLRLPPSSPSRPSTWQPSFSTTTNKETAHSPTIPYRDFAIQPTISSNLGNSNIKESTALPGFISSSFSKEREPLVVIPSPSSSEVFVESSGTSVLWDGEHFNSIPTVELPPPIIASTMSDSHGTTLLLSGTSTIFGSLYSRPTSTKNSDSTALSDLFLSPSSHGAIAGNNGRLPVAPSRNQLPHEYVDEDEELENEFEEGEGLGAAGSNDAATSIVVVSVTATPTTRYITRTETETRTVTQTVVESHPGSPPHTRTVVVTQTVPAEMARPITIVSTIVGTVTEVHTTVESSTTTAVTTVTVTAPTQWPLHTAGVYILGHNSKETSASSENADGDIDSTLEPIDPVNNYPQGSPFDPANFPSFPLRPIMSSTTKDNLQLQDHESNEAVSGGDREESDLNESELGEENVEEGYTVNILPNEEKGREGNHPVCQPECEAARNEICVDEAPEEEMVGAIEGPRCVCRPGFARLFPDRPCMPTYTYQLRLLLDRIGKHRLSYHADLDDPQTEEFRELQEATQDGLERVAMQSDIRDLFHGISIAGFEPLSEATETAKDKESSENSDQPSDDKESTGHHITSQPDDGVVVNFYVKLSDNMEEDKLKEMFEKTLKQNNYSVGGTDLYARRKEGLLEISDFDECSNPDFNDCSDQAQCFNLHGTYTCSCKEGYADLSENSEFPGRICSAEVLGCDTCKYHGQCYTDTNGKVGCKCFHWYSGEKCQINLKVLLIALVTIGAILLILVFVCIMLACMKRKKPDMRHAAPGFMRCRGPAGIMRGGSLDKTAMIPDTSSESSFEGALPPPPLTYVPLVHHRLSTSTQGSKLKSEGLTAERREKTVPIAGPSSMNTGFNEQDRSLTVMIPRAKYRPAPPLLATAAAGSTSASPMTSFGVVLIEGENRERRASAPNEQKLLAFLDGTDSHNQGRQGTPTKQKQIGPTVTNHENSGNPKKLSSSRKPSTGALVSAGFEVSATIVKDKWPPESVGSNGNQLEDDVDDTSGTGRGIDSHLHHTLASNGSHFTTLRTGDRTVSEARSYDETIVHPPKKSLLHGGLSGCGSKPSSQHGLHHSNDEAHTMAERDVGSTFLMPQTQLYKPSRGSDNSNFDSL